jgi:protocatechuate 3,4-dioxygenase beta subunit
MSKIRTLAASLIGFLLIVSALGAQQATLRGRVFDNRNGRGVPGLTVRLEAPKADGGRLIATATDAEGRFELPNLYPGRYLLTVSQGPTPVHRQVLDLNGETRVDIPLQPD